MRSHRISHPISPVGWPNGDMPRVAEWIGGPQVTHPFRAIRDATLGALGDGLKKWQRCQKEQEANIRQ